MKVKQIKLKIEEWSEIKDNPRQRDTVIHAKKSLRLHLSEYSETQSRVAAAELPCGTRYKLDGHTRSYLWDREELKTPKVLYCDLYLVQSIEQVNSLYNCFDNQSAAETAQDRLASAFNLHKVNHTSRIFRSGGTTTALKCLYSIRRTGFVRLDVADPVLIFKKSLNLIDKCNFSHFNFPSPVIAAMILSVHKDGQAAIPFWQDYDIDAGKKTPKKFDAVFALREFISTSRSSGEFPRGSIEAVHRVTPKVLAIYEKWGTMLTKSPISRQTLDDVVFSYCQNIYKSLDRDKKRTKLELVA